MEWLSVALVLIALYLLISWYIRAHHLWEEHITFYGPILALKTDKVEIFDRFVPWQRFFRAYGTAGALMVVVISVLMSVMLFIGLRNNIANPPDTTGIYAVQNWFVIPGVNEFIPFTLAVWLAFIVTIAIHEFGHGVLSRIEGIAVRSTGVLFAVIPIGAFVEPDEEELQAARPWSRIRMFGAGITNNLVMAAVCFFALLVVLSLAVPIPSPVISAELEGGPAMEAGLPLGSVVLALDGIQVPDQAHLIAALNNTVPGETITLTLSDGGVVGDYPVKLGEWPDMPNRRDSGYLGVNFYSAPLVRDVVIDTYLASWAGPLLLIYVPIDTVLNGEQLQLGMLAFDSEYMALWETPFPLYWGMVHLLFWLFWFNFAVGTFNALPLVPLDGGYIMQTAVMNFFEKRKMAGIGRGVVAGISIMMLVIIVAMLTVPYLFSLL